MTTRTIHGIPLHRDKDYWIGQIDGEKWVFEQFGPSRRWRGWTWDHLTGCPVSLTLANAIRWVQSNRRDIGAKLKVRREHQTRMVDPPESA
jgi:hypothetical protein